MENKLSLNTIRACLGLLLLLFSTNTIATNNFIAWDKTGAQWLQQTSTHFSVNYLQHQQNSASKILLMAEQVHQQLQPFFNVTPSKRTEIILFDYLDVLPPYESTLEHGEIRLIMSPPTHFDLVETQDDWLRLSLAHEYSYILQMQLAQGTWRGFFISADFTPAMLLEGVAVYLEKNNQLNLERLSSSLFNMQMRMQVKHGALHDLQKVIIKNREWPLNSNQLYGAYFIHFLINSYGEEKLLTFLNNYSQHLTSYVFLNNETTKVYGKSFLTLWEEFNIYLHEVFSEQIQSLEKQKVEGELLSSSPLLQLTASDVHGLLINKRNGDDRHNIQQYKNNQWHSITPTNQLQDMDNHPQAGIVATRTINYVNGRQYNDIFLYKQGGWKRFSEQGRFRHVRYMPDGKHILATRIIDGLSELWLLNVDDSDDTKMLWQGSDNIILGKFDVSPTGEFIVASIKYPLTEWKLGKFDLIAKEWKNLTQQSGFEHSPMFLEDNTLIYSANYTGVSNIYHLDIENKTIIQWTNVVGGAFDPIWQPGLGLVFQSYDDARYTLRHIEEPKPISTLTFSNQQPTDISNNEIKKQLPEEHTQLSEPTAYSTWETIQPHSWLPIVYIDEIRTLIGLNTYGGDALGRHNYEVYALWDTKNELGSYFLEYRYDNRWSLNYLKDYKFKNINIAHSTPRYEISSNKAYLAQRNHLFSAWEDRLSLHAGISMNFDELLYQPPVAETLPTIENNTTEVKAGIAMTFDNQEYYLNVPGVGWGHYYDFTFEENILNSDYDGQKYQTQWRATWDLPGRMTILTRLAAGYSSDEAKKYTLGGNNLKAEMHLFDRNNQAIRGYDDITLQGHFYATQRIELNALLGRFERNWGLFPIGVGDVSSTFFIDSGSAWDNGDNYDPITGVGAQLQLEFKLGYNYALPVSLGYAYGTDDALGKSYFYLNFGSNY